MGKDSKQVTKQEAQQEMFKSVVIDILDEISMSRKDLDVNEINQVLQNISQKAIPVLMMMAQVASDDQINVQAWEMFMSSGTKQLHDWVKEE